MRNKAINQEPALNSKARVPIQCRKKGLDLGLLVLAGPIDFVRLQ